MNIVLVSACIRYLRPRFNRSAFYTTSMWIMYTYMLSWLLRRQLDQPAENLQAPSSMRQCANYARTSSCYDITHGQFHHNNLPVGMYIYGQCKFYRDSLVTYVLYSRYNYWGSLRFLQPSSSDGLGLCRCRSLLGVAYTALARIGWLLQMRPEQCSKLRFDDRVDLS